MIRNKHIILIVLIVFVLFLSSCNMPFGSENTYSVSGVVVQQGEPLARASVSIDNKLNFSTTTDDNGSFVISDVPKGDHTLLIKNSLDDGSFVQNESQISVNNDLVLNSLVLPAPVILYEPEGTSDESTIVSWSKSDAEDFREYKVYRHTTPGLDETTGTLCYVTIARDDTSFIDQELDPVTTYYYRVFVMNEYGKLGGSNITSTKTENTNFVLNGSFDEDINPFQYWNSFWTGSAELDSTESHSGKYSLSLIMGNFQGFFRDYALISHGSLSDIPGNEWYRLSMWIKTSGEVETGWIDYVETQYSDLRAGVYDHGAIESFGINGNTDWTYVEKIFYLSENARSYTMLTLGSSSEHAWFDDIKLELYEQP